MKAEYVWACLWAATQENEEDPLKLEMVIGLIQANFLEDNLEVDCAWKTVVLIPKGNNNFCGIRLVEVLWKTMTRILNCRLKAVIQFHDTMPSFCICRGTRTGSLGAKLIQQLMALREEVLYEIFLYLHKSYNALERDNCLGILLSYGVGPRALRLLRP